MSEMFDDVDDKIRRNLIVFSFFVLAAWWLELPLDWPLDKRETFSNVNQTKFLWLALAVQIYLLLRYRFSKSSTKAFSEYKIEAEKLFRRRLETYIAKKITNFSKNLDVSLFSPSLRRYVEHEEKDDLRGDAEPNKLVAIEVKSINFEAKWSGTVSCVRTLFGSKNNEIKRSGGVEPIFFVHKFDQAIVWLKVLAHISLYTRGAIELLLPVALGIASCITILCGLVNLEAIQALLHYVAHLVADLYNVAWLPYFGGQQVPSSPAR